MTPRDPARRRRAAAVARTGFIVSALGFASALGSAVAGPASPAAAVAAQATIVEIADGGGLGAPLTGGGSQDDFGLLLPVGAACPGDSANDGYRVAGYMVASSVDPATIRFDSAGPVGNQFGEPQATFRQPLSDANGTPYIAGQTANASPPPGPGPITGLPAFSFSAFTDLAGGFGIPPGTYNLGVGCFVPAAGAEGAAMEDFWNVVITVATDTADPGPADIAWSVVAPPESTSVVLSTDPSAGAAPGDEVELLATVLPDDAPGTITFRDGGVDLGPAVAVAAGAAAMTTDDLGAGDHVLSATFTPADGSGFAPSTSSEVPFSVVVGGAATTSTTAGGSSTTTLAGATTTTAIGGGGVSTGSPLGSLARTGGSISMVVWGGLMVLFGRMAILLGRRPSVRPAGR